MLLNQRVSQPSVSHIQYSTVQYSSVQCSISPSCTVRNWATQCYKFSNLLYSTKSYCTARDMFCCILLRPHRSMTFSHGYRQMMGWHSADGNVIISVDCGTPDYAWQFLINSSFFLNFYFSKSKNSRESYEAAGWSRSIWKQVRSYFYYLLCFHLYVFCV